MIPTSLCPDGKSLYNVIVEVNALPDAVFTYPNATTALKELITNNASVFCRLCNDVQLAKVLGNLSDKVLKLAYNSPEREYLKGAFEALAKEVVLPKDFRLIPNDNTPFKIYQRLHPTA